MKSIARYIPPIVACLVILAGCKARDSGAPNAPPPPKHQSLTPIEVARDRFVSMWERGGDSFTVFESEPLSTETAEAIVAYIHFNMMMYGLGAWSATPSIRPGAEGPEQASGEDYQTFSKLRRSSYILLEAAELNGVFDKFDSKPYSEHKSLYEYLDRVSALQKDYLELYNELLSDRFPRPM